MSDKTSDNSTDKSITQLLERIVKRLEEPNNYTIMCGKHFTTVERVIEIVKEEMEE